MTIVKLKIMKKTYIIILCFLANLTLFAQKETYQMNFKGKTFDLPMTEEIARKTFNLNEFDRNGNIDNRNILVHKKVDDTVVGVTFYTRHFKENSEKSMEVQEYPRKKYITKLEEKYNLTFKPLDIGNTAFINPDFVYMKLEDGNIIVVGDMYYNLMYNSYATVSFFKGIKVKELSSYISTLY
jgi:hypothetical protein